MKKSTKILLGVPILIIGIFIVFMRFDISRELEFDLDFIGMILMFIGAVLLASLLSGKPGRPDPWDAAHTR